MISFKKIFSSLFVTFMVIMVVSCGGSGGGSDSSNNVTPAVGINNLPSSLSVSIPKTLGIQAGGSGPSKISTSSEISKSAGAAPASMAYGNVNATVALIKSQLSSMAFSMVITDRIIDGLTPSNTPVTGRSITFTQELQDTLISLLPESERESMEAHSFVGKTIDIESFTYSTIDEDGYSFKYTETTSPTESFTVYWSSDKNLLKIVSVSEGYTYGIVRNISERSARMYVIINIDAGVSPTGQSMNSMSIVSMKEIDGSTKNGICLSNTYINKKSDCVESFSFEGVADDDGGYITNQYLSLLNSWAVPSRYNYIEGFDSTGALTFQQNGAFVQYGSEPADYKTLYTGCRTSIKSMQGTINYDQAIIGNKTDTLFKEASWAVEGETFLVLDSNSSQVTDALTGCNSDPGNEATYIAALNTHVAGVAIAEKDGTVTVYISNQTIYTNASSLYLVKVDYVPSTQLGTTLQNLSK